MGQGLLLADFLWDKVIVQNGFFTDPHHFPGQMKTQKRKKYLENVRRELPSKSLFTWNRRSPLQCISSDFQKNFKQLVPGSIEQIENYEQNG